MKPDTKQQTPHAENPYNDNETMNTDYPVMLQAMSDTVKLRSEPKWTLILISLV